RRRQRRRGGIVCHGRHQDRAPRGAPHRRWRPTCGESHRALGGSRAAVSPQLPLGRGGGDHAHWSGHHPEQDLARLSRARAAPDRDNEPSPRRSPMSTQKRMPKDLYKRELKSLQSQLVDMQAWVQASGARIVVIFEGRDAAGKGSTIKRVAEYLNPRVSRVVALPTPSARDKTRWYFQRYVSHLPAGGEMVLMDRSWYNRAGVERVMGYSSNAEYHRFLHQAPIFERMLVEDGIILLKYWFSVSDIEQER